MGLHGYILLDCLPPKLPTMYHTSFRNICYQLRYPSPIFPLIAPLSHPHLSLSSSSSFPPPHSVSVCYCIKNTIIAHLCYTSLSLSLPLHPFPSPSLFLFPSPPLPLPRYSPLCYITLSLMEEKVGGGS